MQLPTKKNRPRITEVIDFIMMMERCITNLLTEIVYFLYTLVIEGYYGILYSNSAASCPPVALAANINSRISEIQSEVLPPSRGDMLATFLYSTGPVCLNTFTA